MQGGVFTSPEVAETMQWLEQQGAVAIGQTSWGPTGFCAVDNAQKADALIEALQDKFSCFNQLSFVSASARNSGGDVFITDDMSS